MGIHDRRTTVEFYRRRRCCFGAGDAAALADDGDGGGILGCVGLASEAGKTARHVEHLGTESLRLKADQMRHDRNRSITKGGGVK